MTEERMFRIREDMCEGNDYGKFHFKGYIDICAEELEFAPPKDFLPTCRYLKLCKQGVSMGWEPCIMRCPYREE